MSAKQQSKVPVTHRALIQRINRKLAKEGQQLRKTRGMRAYLDLGEYFVLDLSGNYPVKKLNEPDLVPYARKLGALRPFETLAKE